MSVSKLSMRLSSTLMAIYSLNAYPAPTPQNIVSQGLTTLTGTVRAKGQPKPLSQAEVIDLGNRDNSVLTEKDGSFSLEVGPETTAILIRAEGYEDLIIKRGEQGWPRAQATYALEPTAELVGKGVIRARKKAEVSQSSLTRREIDRVAGTGGDAVQALQSLPGVLPAGFGSNIAVRGSGPGDNSYYFDRLELPFVFHLGGLGTVVPTRMLDGIDLFAAGFSSLYSNSTGAIVQLRSETSFPEVKSGEANLSLWQAGGYLEGTTETEQKIGYRVGFRRSYLELYTPLIKKAAGDNASLTTIPQITDYQAVLNGVFPGGSWQGYLIGAANRLRIAAPTELTDSEDGKSRFSLFNYFQTSGLRVNKKLSDENAFIGGFQQRLTIIDQEFFSNVVKVKSHRLSFPLALEKRGSESWTLTWGIRPEIERVETKVDAIQIPAGGPNPFFDVDTAPRSQERDTYVDVYGYVFSDLIYKMSQDLSLNPGLGVFKGPRKYQTSIDPRVLLRWKVLENTTFKFAAGHYSQRPEPAYDSKKYGNPDLKLEKAIHVVGGSETQWSPLWESDIQVYYKTLYDLVTSDVEQPSRKYANQGKGRAYGFDVFVKKVRSGAWNGWLSYGYSVSKRQDPKNKKWVVFDYDRTHAFNLVNSYRPTGRWELSSRIQWTSGAPYTQIPGGWFNANTGRYRPKQDESYSLEKNDARQPAFFQWDVRSDYDFLFDTWKLDFYIDIQNVTARQNVEGSRYSPDYRKKEYVYSLGILPNIGVIASF